MKERGVDSDKDENKDLNDNDTVDSNTLIFRHSNQPVVRCISGREGGDFDNDDNNNNNGRRLGLILMRMTTKTICPFLLTNSSQSVAAQVISLGRYFRGYRYKSKSNTHRHAFLCQYCV